jgi:hypothetical protein
MVAAPLLVLLFAFGATHAYAQTPSKPPESYKSTVTAPIDDRLHKTVRMGTYP